MAIKVIRHRWQRFVQGIEISSQVFITRIARLSIYAAHGFRLASLSYVWESILLAMTSQGMGSMPPFPPAPPTIVIRPMNGAHGASASGAPAHPSFFSSGASLSVGPLPPPTSNGTDHHRSSMEVDASAHNPPPANVGSPIDLTSDDPSEIHGIMPVQNLSGASSSSAVHVGLGGPHAPPPSPSPSQDFTSEFLGSPIYKLMYNQFVYLHKEVSRLNGIIAVQQRELDISRSYQAEIAAKAEQARRDALAAEDGYHYLDRERKYYEDKVHSISDKMDRMFNS